MVREWLRIAPIWTPVLDQVELEQRLGRKGAT
jgi:hypothetical protein